jgi:hypothetical protein
MNEFAMPFTPGDSGLQPLPLSRFLPPLPAGMVRAWLQENVLPGSYILDPLGSSPTLTLEAARAGYRVLVACSNPILSFILETLSTSPSKADFQAVLSELGRTKRGEERLEVHLQSLYLTDCAGCGRRIQAQSYLWRKGETQPYARIYHCPYCGDEGEHPLGELDVEKLAVPGNTSLHKAWAMARVSQPGDTLREGVDEALQMYLARPLYFVFTLINRMEGLGLSPDRKRLLMALALTICDDATTLWPHPSGRLRPRQLTTPPQFHEKNLWLALDNAIAAWSSQMGVVPVLPWPQPEIPPGVIGIYRGRLKSIFPLPPEIRPAAAVAVLPRPNQAYWTLSAMWAGWLWGKEAVQPLHSALERRRYDWHWHAAALHQALAPLSKNLPSATPVLGLIPELGPGFFSAAVVAAESAGLHFNRCAVQADEEIGQVLWQAEHQASTPGSVDPWEKPVETGAIEYLRTRNEPAPYLPLYTAALSHLAYTGVLPFNQVQYSADSFVHLQASVQKALYNPEAFVRYDSRPQNPESGLWWLVHPPPELEAPISDQLEMEIVRFLQKNPGQTQSDLEITLYRAFKGLLTPSREFIHTCLQSYGDASSSLPEHWQLRPQENPSARRSDLSAARSGLEILANELGYLQQGENPVLWQDSQGNTAYCFFLLVSGLIGKYLLSPTPISPARCILVLPGSRANLVAFKIHHDPRLAEALEQGWRFLKFRLLRQLLDRKNLTRSLFEEMLQADPPRWEFEATQMSIFPAV